MSMGAKASLITKPVKKIWQTPPRWLAPTMSFLACGVLLYDVTLFDVVWFQVLAAIGACLTFNNAIQAIDTYSTQHDVRIDLHSRNLTPEERVILREILWDALQEVESELPVEVEHE